MVETNVSTNSVGCATPSKPSVYHYKSLKELFDGVGKDEFEYWGDRYFRFLEIYERIKPKWRYALWGGTRFVDYAFMVMKDYPTIAKAMGHSIIFHITTQRLTEAQMQLGDLMERKEEFEAEFPHKKQSPMNHYIK